MQFPRYTRRLSSCEKATELTHWLWPSSVWRHLPEAASQILTVLSLDADARRLSSCEKATELTRWLWPSSVWRHLPEAASLVLMVLSLVADARFFTSFIKPTTVIQSVG